MLPLANTKTADQRDNPWAWRSLLARAAPVKNRVPLQIQTMTNRCFTGECRWPLVLLGEAGSGKTCAALLILRAMGRPGWYMTFAAWCDRIRYAKCGMLQSVAGYNMTETGVWRDWEKVDLAVLDDIGTREKASDHVYEAFKGALDRREGLPTVYTSNLKLEEIEPLFDDRVASRLSAGTIVYLEGDQRQPEKE